MRSQQKMRARKATWLAFGLIALSAASSYAQETTQQGALSVPAVGSPTPKPAASPSPEEGKNTVSFDNTRFSNRNH
jgi:hypothetical protein